MPKPLVRCRVLSLCTAAAAVTLALAPSLCAQEPVNERQITWLTMDFPPFYIHEGSDRGGGIADRTAQMVEGKLAQRGYSHVEELSNPTDILARLRAGQHVCSSAYIRTPEREKFMAFSMPDLILPPNGITVRRAELARFGSGGPVSLRALLARRDLKLAVALGRSYGTDLDALLAEHKGDPHVYWRKGEDIYASLLDMLARGSIDYVIGYPYEARYLADRKGIGEQIANLPLTESGGYTLAHIVCPANAWGRAVVADVDRALVELRPTDEYRGAIERWLDDGMKEEFRRQYQELFLTAGH